MALGTSASSGFGLAPAGQSYGGKVWNAATGGYEDPNAALIRERKKAALTAPQYVTSPLGRVSTYENGGWQDIGAMQGSSSLGRVGSSGGGSGGDDGRDPAIKASMLALINSLKDKGPMPEPPQPFDMADESAAETAMRTQAKENAGLRLQGSVKALGGLMSRRGIGGSGIHGSKLAGLVNANAGEQAQTDRDVLFSRTNRARDIANQEYDARNNYDARLQQYHAQEQQRIQGLLSYYGMLY